MIDYYCLSDVGLHRLTNQDSYMSATNDSGDFLTLVCDGIGGGKAGDVASSKTAEYIKERFTNTSFTSLCDAKSKMSNLIEDCNKYIYSLSIKSPANIEPHRIL